VPSPLAGLIEPSRLTSIVDIGANPIDGDPPYQAMLAAGLCTVTGFEPQPEALVELKRKQGPHETYLPYAVGDGKAHTLRIASASGMTSLLVPDARRLAMFNGFPPWGQVVAEEELETKRLDDIDELPPIDLLKIDIQGGELAVFRGGDAALADAVAVHTEVSFVPLYEEQPVFGDIDLDLRARGFIPHAFAAIKRWAIAPVTFAGDFRVPGNQLLEADVVYVRDFGKPEELSDDQLRQLAMIAHHVYQSIDLAYFCVMTLAQRGLADANAANRYLENLAST
jgi:FkbM family methyltransferase